MTSTSDATVETSEEDLAALLDDAGVTDDTDDTFNDTDDELSDKPTQVWTSNGALHRFNIFSTGVKTHAVFITLQVI